MCRLFRPILLRMTTTMRGTEPTGPPEYRLVEWSTDWGFFSETNLLRVVTTNVWIALSDLFECRLAWWSTIESDVVRRAHFKWLRSHCEVQLASLLQSVIELGEVQLCIRLSLLDSSRKNWWRMLYANLWRPTTSWRSSSSHTRCWEWRPSMRKHKQHLCWKNLEHKS